MAVHGGEELGPGLVHGVGWGVGVLAGGGCLAGEGGKGWRRGFPESREAAFLQESRGDGGRGACEGGGSLGQGLLPFVGAFGEEGVSLPEEEGPVLECWRGAGGLRRSLWAGVPGTGWGAAGGRGL